MIGNFISQAVHILQVVNFLTKVQKENIMENLAVVAVQNGTTAFDKELAELMRDRASFKFERRFGDSMVSSMWHGDISYNSTIDEILFKKTLYTFYVGVRAERVLRLSEVAAVYNESRDGKVVEFATINFEELDVQFKDVITFVNTLPAKIKEAGADAIFAAIQIRFCDEKESI